MMFRKTGIIMNRLSNMLAVYAEIPEKQHHQILRLFQHSNILVINSFFVQSIYSKLKQNSQKPTMITLLSVSSLYFVIINIISARK